MIYLDTPVTIIDDGTDRSIGIKFSEPEGWEGDFAVVTINKLLTIKADEKDVFKLFEDYHKNGIVEILKWQDVVHLNPNDFKNK